MKAYLAALAALALCGGAAASALSGCATGADTPSTTNGFTPTGGTSTSSGGGSSSGSSTPDATVTSSSSSGSYGDDTSNASSSSGASSSSSSGGDDGGGQPTPGPTCTTGQACVDGIPSGWSGFVQLLLGGAGDAGAACAAPYNSVQPSLGGQTNPDGGPATCGACSCGLPDGGVSCTIKVENDDTGCFLLGTESDTTVPQNICTKLTATTGANGHVGTPAVDSNGAQCIAQGGAPTTAPPPPTSTTAVACGPSDAGAAPEGGTGMTCLSGQACASLPVGVDAGTPSGVCVYQNGIQSCPPAGTTVFTNTFVVGGVEDTRGCGCTCGDPTCPGDGYVAGFTAAGCTGAPSYTFDAGAKCITINNNRPTYAFYHPSRSGSLGTCGAATGGPSGQVDIDAGSATTFCCVP